MKAFENVDVILTPTTPDIAFKIGEKSNDPIQMYLSDIFTVSINMATVPAISIPCGFKNGLPIGMQLIAKPFNEEILFTVGHYYERLNDFYKRFPNG
ncbi:glutamyl-tRNA(Gln) amidotransferase, A subunit [Hydrogenivirga sp. 128-5-R1-1]|nr:glutamyl-tRNA(Gln) amidotransferase, A subunit [Hydrogenivirga sp. 128-5-R1-1]